MSHCFARVHGSHDAVAALQYLTVCRECAIPILVRPANEIVGLRLQPLIVGQTARMFWSVGLWTWPLETE